MANPPAGWYGDPDPLAKTTYPVRWWDGERWSGHQAWYRGRWVRPGERCAGVRLFARQHPWVTGLVEMLLWMAPWVIGNRVTGGSDLSITFAFGCWLAFGLLTGLTCSWRGFMPTSLPPAPADPPRGRAPQGRPLEA